MTPPCNVDAASDRFSATGSRCNFRGNARSSLSLPASMHQSEFTDAVRVKTAFAFRLQHVILCGHDLFEVVPSPRENSVDLFLTMQLTNFDWPYSRAAILHVSESSFVVVETYVDYNN
jgi:hypothetical protein